MQQMRDIEKYTNDYLSDDYDFEKIQVKYRRKKVLEILNQYKPKRILEVGSGADSIANYYTNFEKFVVVEPSEVFIKQCIKIENNNNILLINDFVENRIDDLKREKFDFIILSSLLHEVTNPNEFLKQIISICNSNTILHINVPNSSSFHLLWAYESGLINNMGNLTERAKQLQQNTTFDIPKLSEMIQHNDMKMLEKGSYFIKPFNHNKMLELYKSNIIDDKLLDGLYNMVKYIIPDMGSEIYVNCRLK